MNSRSGPRGPRPLGDILGQLMAARGYGRLKTRRDIEAAWAAAAGEPAATQTRIHGFRHGVLTIAVAHSALLEELVAFRKTELLQALRNQAPELQFRDLRFRVGTVDDKGGKSPV